MKIRYCNTFLMLLAILGTIQLHAQVSAYPFTQLTSTYTPITGGQVLGTATNDDISFVDPAFPAGGATTGVGFPIGFNFTYNGRVYDRFGVNSNGYIALGQSTLTPSVNIASTYTPISSANTASLPLQNRISGFSRDLLGYTGSTLRYQTIGTAPNRILVVQWSGYGRWPTTAGDVVNFQIRLNEVGNIIQVVYGTCSATSTTNMSPQIGLRGDAVSDFNNRTAVVANWTTTAAGTVNTATCTFSNTIRPASGTTFQWGLLVNNDVGISTLNTPFAPLSPGLQPVQVTINNYGANVINSANVEWSAGGILQTPASFTGPLVAGSTSTVNLGNFNFPVNPTLYRFWTNLPNGNVDGRVSNDTFQITLCGALAAGVYTVGTPTSDFPTIADMMSAIYSCGISGPVTMNIQPGTYNGSVKFVGQIVGASNVNRITINGAGQGLTILDHDGTGTNGNATLAFDGVRYVTVQNLTIRNSKSTLGWGALFTNNAQYNQLLNNNIEMYYVPNVISVYAVAFQSSYTTAGSEGICGNYNLIQGNTLSGGDMGMRIEGAAATRNIGNRFINNTISNVDDYGIYIDDQDSIDIIGNRISLLFSATTYGLYLSDLTSFEISKNNITSNNYGIYCFNMGTAGTVTRRNTLTNNMVLSKVTYGLYLSGARSIDIYHNTIHMNGTSTTNATAYIFTPNDLNIKNNIFSNETGYVFRSGSNIAFASMDNNLFYQRIANPTNNFISFGTTLFNDFGQWQANTFGHGVNDVYGDPVFFGPNDLHVDGALANDAGDNAVGITTDIDGETRPFTGATTVDIGADEYKPKDNDAGVIALLTPVSPLASGFQPINITVKNFAVQPLNIFTVQWKYNGVLQSNFTYTGSPIAPNQTTDVTLGSINFFTGQNADLEFWTILPNSQSDERTSNDTLRTYLCQGLTGNYTLGTPTSDFPTFAEAIATLYQCGVVGPVTFNIQPGVYSGQQLALLGNIPGSSAVNTVIFDGGSPAQVTLTHNGSGILKAATVLLSEVQYITVQNMTINTTAASGFRGHAVHLINQADNNNIIGNVINATWFAAINDIIGIAVSSSLSDDFAEGISANNLRIEDNIINGGEMSIHIEGGTAVQGVIRNISIINNQLTGFDDYGIYADEIDTLEIVGNTITSLTGSTIAAGMYLFDLVYFNIERNAIHTLDYGIYLSNTNNPSFGARAKVVNNMVTSQTDDALYATTIGTTDFFHNTFASRTVSTSGANGAYILSPISGTLDFRNNIFFTSSTSTTSYAFQMSVNTAQLDMDNNLFFSNAPNNIIRYGTTNYTFANWRTNNVYSYDQNSLSVNPLFVNLSTGDLHIQNGALNAAADSLVAVATDIDMEARPSLNTTRPDIGADEILLVSNDAIAIGLTNPVNAVCENAIQLVEVQVGNNGTDPLSTVNVTVNVSGPVNTTLTGTFSGNLNTGQTALINVGNINTTGGGTFCFEIITQLSGDLNPQNDTIVICRNIIPAVPVLVADTTCVNQSAFLTTSPAGGVAWYDQATAGVLLSTSDTFATGPLASSTTYFVEVVACGNTRYQIDATVISPLPISIGNDTTICSNGTATLTAPNASSYIWSNGQTTQSVTVQSAANYSVTITDADGCFLDDNADVSQFISASTSATSNTLLCGSAGTGVIDLTVSAGAAPFAYSWSNGANTEDLSGLNTGTFDLTVTDNNGCEYTDSYTVNGPTSLSFNSVNTSSPSCGVLTDGIIDISVAGGIAPYSYLWSNGSTNEDLSGVANGTYSVTVTDGNGCQTNISSTLNVVSTVAITIDNVSDESLILGGGIDVSVSGGQAPYFILWNTGATTSSVSGLAAGTYTVTVSDINGCLAEQTVVVDYTIPSLVDHIESVQSLNIFPNPTSDFVNFQLILNEETEVRLEIYNLAGQVIQTFTSQNGLNQNYKADLSDYPAAVYMARMIVGSDVITAKIVLKK